MPVYNCRPYVSQSIESLLAQTYRDFVFIISDNASTEDAGAISSLTRIRCLSSGDRFREWPKTLPTFKLSTRACVKIVFQP